MQAIICDAYDSPAKLAVSTVDQPEPKPNEVLVAIKATGLGYVDALTVAGLYQIKPRLPFIPGNEVSGVVEQVGADVKHLRAAERILAMPSYGGLAEKSMRRSMFVSKGNPPEELAIVVSMPLRILKSFRKLRC